MAQIAVTVNRRDLNVTSGNAIEDKGCNLPEEYQKIDLTTTGTIEKSALYVAIKNNWEFMVRNFLKDGGLFEAVYFSEEFSGFTILHHACLQGDLRMATKFIDQYEVNPTFKACDGVEPIHLAAFRGRFDIVFKILEEGVDIRTKISYSNFQKYHIKGQIWQTRFGDEMDLFTYIMFNNNKQRSPSPCPMSNFLKFKPNVSARDKDNKTLLMYAIENCQRDTVNFMFDKLNIQELLRRDVAGYSALHKILMIKDDSHWGTTSAKDNKLSLLLKLLSTGVDINVMANNDPNTLPVHIAAYQADSQALYLLMSRRKIFHRHPSRPLFYFTQGWKCRNHNSENELSSSDKLVLESIFKDMHIKYLCEYPVHEEETKLMNQWLENTNVSRMVSMLNKKLNDDVATMKNMTVIFGNSSMSLYEILKAPQETYELVVKMGFNQIIIDANYALQFDPYLEIINMRLKKIKEAQETFKKQQKVATPMIKSLLLPYDCILPILKYLTLNELNNLEIAYFEMRPRPQSQPAFRFSTDRFSPFSRPKKSEPKPTKSTRRLNIKFRL